MREIKFRAWDKSKKLLLSVGALGLPIGKKSTGQKLCRAGSIFLMGDNNNYHQKLSKIELMQFTGLLDKNGHEIYEFHIICDKFIIAKYKNYYYLVDISNGDILYNGIQNEKLEITGEYFSLSKDSKRSIDKYIQQAERTLANKRNSFAIL